MANNRYLLKHRQGYYAVIEVPISLRPRLGRRLKRSLKTTDINIARARRHRAVAELHSVIEAARRQKPDGDPLVVEAMEWREASRAADYRDRNLSEDDLRGGVITQSELVADAIAERAEQLYASKGRWEEFKDLATGDATPVSLMVEQWLSEGSLSGRPIAPRTALERRSSVSGLASWLTENGLPAYVETVSKRLAGRYVSDALIPSGRASATLAKLIQSLASYWAWLQKRGHLPDDVANPWTGQSPRRAPVSGLETERAFTEAEMTLLLVAPPSPLMDDFIRFAALSGMRREEIGLLKVRDYQDGVFTVRKSKTVAGERRVPCHSLLADMVARRVARKGPETFLFDDLPGSLDGRRTDPIGKNFTYYRRKLGIQDGDSRRSLVNFHSLRRWFVTSAINANQPNHLVSLVVGHKEGGLGMTGRYWSGAQDEALRAVVESVTLPEPAQAAPRSPVRALAPTAP